jgi:hypothetical protein
MKRIRFLYALLILTALFIYDLPVLMPSLNSLFSGRQTWTLEQLVDHSSANQYLLPGPGRDDYYIGKEISGVLPYSGERCVSCTPDRPAGFFLAVARIALP